MPPEIAQNNRKKPNLTPVQRLQIVAKSDAGVSTEELVAEFQRDATTIRRTIRNAKKRGTTEEAARSGRPSLLSLTQKKLLYRKVRSEPKTEYSELSKHAQLALPNGTFSSAPSRSTIYRHLKQRDLTNRRCKIRPKLTQARARLRWRWCNKMRHWNFHQRPIKFSDECSVQKGVGQTREWAFTYPNEIWKTKLVTQKPSSRLPAQMVWGAIWLDRRGRPRRSELIIMERDSDAPRGGYTSQSYIKTLEKGLLPHWRPGQLFQQDNARIHTAAATREWLRSHDITTIDWPAYSPDLNPIEHMWWHLKRLVFKHYPQYNTFSSTQEDWDGFCSALKDCWRRIPNRLIATLIGSLPRRIRACREARGWHTKY